MFSPLEKSGKSSTRQSRRLRHARTVQAIVA